VVFNGPTEEIIHAESVTGQYLHAETPLNGHLRNADDFFEIKNASLNNLKNISVKIPKGVLTCVTGVSGSGKSTLIHECFLPQHPETVVIDQSPIGKSSRANPVTFTGICDQTR